MNDLLVGCSVSCEGKEYVVLRTEATEGQSCVWGMSDEGKVTLLKSDFITVSDKDIKRIKIINRHLNHFREKAIEEMTRSELMDLD